MGCKKQYKTAEANAKSYLRQKGVIDEFLNIKDLNKFRKMNSGLTEWGANQYNMNTKWFFELDGGTRVAPNKEAFKQVDEANGIFYDTFNVNELRMLRKASPQDLEKMAQRATQKIEMIENMANNEASNLILLSTDPVEAKSTLKEYSVSREDFDEAMGFLEANRELITAYAGAKGMRDFSLSSILSMMAQEESHRLKAVTNRLQGNYKQFRSEFIEQVKPFLESLGVEMSLLEDLNEMYGEDVVSATEIIKKAVNLADGKTSPDIIAEQVGLVYINMLGRQHELYKALEKSIQNKKNPIWQDVYYTYRNQDYTMVGEKLLKSQKSMTAMERIMLKKKAVDYSKLRQRAMARTIGEALLNPETVQPKSTLQKIIDFIKNIISGGNIKKLEDSKKIANQIAEKIKKNDTSDFLNSLPEGYELKEYAKSLENEDLSLDIIEWFRDNGGRLTGSLTLRKFGTIYRDKMEDIHDLDFIIPYEATEGDYEAYLAKFKASYPDFEMRFNGKGNMSTWENRKDGTRNYLGFVVKDDALPIYKMKSIQQTLFADGSMRLPGEWQQNPDTFLWYNTSTGQEIEAFLTGDGKLYKASDVILVDFFFKTKFGTDNSKALEKGMNNPSNIFEAKLDIGRAKDLLDLRLYEEYTKDPTTNQKYSFIEKSENMDETDLPVETMLDKHPSEIELQQKLLGFLAQMGIDVMNLDAYKARYKKKFGKTLTPRGLADILNQVVALSDDADIATLSEETAHFAIELLGDNHPAVKRILEKVKGTATYQQVVAKYSELYNGNETMLAKEAAGKILAQVLQNQSQESKGIIRAIKNFWNKIKAIFSKDQAIRNEMQKIAQDILVGNTQEFNKNNLTGKNYILYEIDTVPFQEDGAFKNFLDNHAERIQELKRTWIKAIQKLEHQGKEHGATRIKARLDKLEKDVAKGNNTLALINAINTISAHGRAIAKKHAKDTATLNSRKPDEQAAVLKEKADFILAYEEMVDMMLADLRSDNTTVATKEVKEAIEQELSDISGHISTMRMAYHKIGSEIMADQLLPLAMKNSKKFPSATDQEKLESYNRLVNLLKEAEKDIGWVSRWFDSLAESGDDVLGMLDKLVKDHDEAARLRHYRKAKEIIIMDQKLKDAGHDTSFMYEYYSDSAVEGFKTDLENKEAELKALRERYAKLKKDDTLKPEEIIAQRQAMQDEMRDTWLETVRLKSLIENPLTGNIIAEVNRGEFENNLQNFSEKIHKKYGFPDDIHERFNLKYNRINFQKHVEENEDFYKSFETSFIHSKYHNKYRDYWMEFHEYFMNEYNKEWAEWFRNNTETDPEYIKTIENKARMVYDGIVHESMRTAEGFSQFLYDSLHNTGNSDLEIDQMFSGKYGPEKHTYNVLEREALEFMEGWLSDNRFYDDFIPPGEVEANGWIYKNDLARPSTAKYGNDTYKNMVPAQKEYYEKYMEMREQALAGLPSRYQQKYLAPQVRKDFFERTSNAADIPSSMKLAIQESLQRQVDDEEFGLRLTDEFNNEIDVIPVYYFRKMERMGELSQDLSSSFIQQLVSVEKFKSFTQISNIIEMSKDILKDRNVPTGKLDQLGKKYSDFAGRKVIDPKSGGKAYERWIDYVSMNIYGQRKNDEGKNEFLSMIAGVDVDHAKAVDMFGKYVAITNLALNVYSGVANVGLGNMLTWQEAYSKQWFNRKNLRNADKLYWKSMNEILGSIGVANPTDKMPLFLEMVDVLQDFSQRAQEAELDRSWFKRMMKSSQLFFLNHLGEHQIQSRTALALADTIRLKDKNGNEISLYEAYEVDGNVLKLSEGVTKLDGSAWTEQDLIDYTLKHKAINQSLHGIYNDIDKAAAQKSSLGRLAFMFRKWVFPGWNRRWGKKYYNYTLDSEVEGYYRTLGRFLKGLVTDLRHGQWIYAAKWEELSDYDKQNMKKALTDVAYYMGLMILAGALMNLKGDDDESNWALDFAAYEAFRLRTEVSAFLNPREGLRLLQEPIAGINQINTLINMTKSISPIGAMTGDPFFRRMESGPNKGDLYMWNNGKKLIPLYKTAEGLLTPEEKLKFFNR